MENLKTKSNVFTKKKKNNVKSTKNKLIWSQEDFLIGKWFKIDKEFETSTFAIQKINFQNANQATFIRYFVLIFPSLFFFQILVDQISKIQ